MGRKSREKAEGRRAREREAGGGHAPLPVRQPAPAPVREASVREMLGYDVTDEVLEVDSPPDPPIAESEREELYFQAAEDPQRAIPRLRELVEKYPDAGTLMNWLCMAYVRVDRDAEAEALAEENLRRHPDYLFARLNWAQMLLRNGRAEEVPAVFGGKFDLREMYPHRDVFHETEVLSFLGVLAEYFLAVGALKAASDCVHKLTVAVPDAPDLEPLAARVAAAVMVRLLKEEDERVRAGGRRADRAELRQAFRDLTAQLGLPDALPALGK